MDTCLSCRHWQFSRENADSKRILGWMTPHGMAACAKGESWRAISRHAECANGQFEALPEADVKRRIEWFERNRKGN